MTKTQLYTLLTSILDGNEIDQTLFESLLDMAQMLRENARNWVILRTEDSTQTMTASNSYLTSHDLPSDFRKWYNRTPIVLVDSQGEVQARLTEIPIQEKDRYKHSANFYCDYANSKIYICGSYNQALTIKQYYQKKATLVSLADTNEWAFPSEYHKILAFDVAVFYKLGVDYDVINNQQGNNNASVANAIFKAMTEWDGELAESGLNGQDYNISRSCNFGTTWGNLNNLI